MEGHWIQALVWDIPLACLTAVCAHLAVSSSQTFLHYSLGHHRLGGRLFRNHIGFHHRYYARGHLVSSVHQDIGGNNTPYFLVLTVIVGGGMFFLLPHYLFATASVASALSFYAHVCLDREYHVEDSRLQRFSWFRRKQQRHFVHHLHANSNFAVIDFFWDRLLGTYRDPDADLS
jgi:sterol desaturase/sphingolipid hydroxylase (fatty acid hydroxylase superfamily)